MMNRISPQTHFLGFFSWIGLAGVWGAIFGMGLSQPDPLNLFTDTHFERRAVVFVNESGMDWTNKPQVHSVTQNKGTVLRVRSDIHGVERGNSLIGKTIFF